MSHGNIFKPQRYSLADTISEPFIDPAEIRNILAETSNPSQREVADALSAAMFRQRLTLRQTAVLLNSDRECEAEVFKAARSLKKEIYGDRIVIFAPLYIGNKCVNNCSYCGFRSGNTQAIRRTLEMKEITAEVRALEGSGQKRLILVYGEHPQYDARYIADTVREVYATRDGHDSINRVNINAAPFDVEGFGIIKESGIGTYQIFQETYDPEVYAKYHRGGPKTDYNFRLTAMDRAMQAGIDDVGLGVLFGLGEWKFEVMALMRHVNHLEACFGVGPHTISFPRIKPASNVDSSILSPVSDDDFKKLVAVLRLAVPYTGLILTAREPVALRDELIGYGVSQIDAGTNLEIGGYSEEEGEQNLDREQFELMDTRTLEQTVTELVSQGHIPSFCTACYRKGRTGEHFMSFSTKGFIKRYCTPNALLTFAEYLEDYAGAETRAAGWGLIEREVSGLDEKSRAITTDILERIKSGERDVLL